MSNPPFDDLNLVQAQEISIPESLPILPIPGGVLFPSALLPLAVSGEPWVQLIDDAALSTRLVGVFFRKEEGNGFDPLSLGQTGSVAQIARLS
ncbi:MAG: LON peptidase substrate-binding domain-containing protein [Chloroflexaceae bacterium]|nr:LON peptidase substrate-binding domain-containing protein [Chloroflexaceae bacterium]